jgi:hypothetical protein
LTCRAWFWPDFRHENKLNFVVDVNQNMMQRMESVKLKQINIMKDHERSNLFWEAYTRYLNIGTAEVASGLTPEGQARFWKRLPSFCPSSGAPSPYTVNATLCQFVNECLATENREGHSKWISEGLRDAWYSVQLDGRRYSFATGEFVFES